MSKSGFSIADLQQGAKKLNHNDEDRPAEGKVSISAEDEAALEA